MTASLLRKSIDLDAPNPSRLVDTPSPTKALNLDAPPAKDYGWSSDLSDYGEKTIVPWLAEAAQADHLGGKAIRALGWIGEQHSKIPGYDIAERALANVGGGVAGAFGVDPRIGMLVGTILMPDITDIIPGLGSAVGGAATKAGKKALKGISKNPASIMGLDLLTKNAENFNVYNFSGLSEGVPNYLDSVSPWSKNKIDKVLGQDWVKSGGELDLQIKELLRVKKTSANFPKERVGTQKKLSELTKEELDTYKSLVATGPAQNADDLLWYGYKDNLPARTIELKGDPRYKPKYDKSLQFHHKAMKHLQYEIHQRARDLRDAGKATDDDLLNLHALANSLDHSSGSRLSAVEWMDRVPHLTMHKKITIPEGIEPNTVKWNDLPLYKEVKGKGKWEAPSKIPEVSKEVYDIMKEAKNRLGIDNITRHDLHYVQNWSNAGVDEVGNRVTDLYGAVDRWLGAKYDDVNTLQVKKSWQLSGPDGESEMSRLVNRVKDMDIRDLHEFQREVLEDIAIPMTTEAKAIQEFADGLTPNELLSFNKDLPGFMRQYKAYRDRAARMDKFKAGEKVEDLQKALYNE